MEPSNVSVTETKFWSIVRAAFFIFKQGICKGKLMHDLTHMLKRGKIAGKAAIHNLMFHQVHLSAAAEHRRSSGTAPPNEYEFSCSNSPAYPSFYFPSNKKHKHALHFPCVHAPPTDDGVATAMKALELHMLQNGETGSPELPGFGRTPSVRQLRVTDSPFNFKDGEADSHVDEAAEEFISRFYRDLKRQNDD